MATTAKKRVYMVVIDDGDDDSAEVVYDCTHAVDAARRVADDNGFGATLHEGATALGRWTIATDDEHRVSAWHPADLLEAWRSDLQNVDANVDGSFADWVQRRVQSQRGAR